MTTLNRRRVASELYLPYDVPTVRQADAEKSRSNGTRDINVGPFIKIRQIPVSSRVEVNIRSIVCYKCPSMVGGEALQEDHWTVYAPNLADALAKAGHHLENCHKEGSYVC